MSSARDVFCRFAKACNFVTVVFGTSMRYFQEQVIYLYVICINAGEILTMPGLPRVPAANVIGVDDGRTIGLFY